MRNPPTDYDGAWKEALEVYLQPFLELAFPAVAAAIDWSQPVKFLNTELQELLQLMRLLDWLMTLPEPEELVFREKLTQLEEEKAMPFVTSYERLSREEGLQQGRLDGETRALRETVLDLLGIRLGGVPEAVRQAVAVEADPARLRSWCRRAATVPDLATFVRQLEGR